MVSYADDHQTVIGYHGTRRETALRIVQRLGPFGRSQNDDDWLGNGIYFWEYAPRQAWLWADQRRRRKRWSGEIAVVASMIRLGSCFDLLDPENVKTLGVLHRGYTKIIGERGGSLPKNVKSRKWLNCAIFEFAYADFEAKGDPVDTCRAVFVPTTKPNRIWSGSGINAHAHIQICVRNTACILGTWLVKPLEEIQDGPRELL